MNTLTRIKKFILNPTKIIRRRWSKFYAQKRFASEDGYHAEAYWTYRLSRFGLDLMGAGRSDLSHAENLIMYEDAKDVLLNLCSDEGVDFSKAKVLDVGCGTGYYTSVLKSQGVPHYVGIDITDTLLERLCFEYPLYEFRKLDISTQLLKDQYNVIMMIDVAQHITDKQKFSFAMQNIKSTLSSNGVFIVSADLTMNKRSSYYEVSKSMDLFCNEFEGYMISDPRVFRDKFIFSIKSNNK